MARSREGMPTARFYQLAGSSLETALAALLAKILEQNGRACVLARDALHLRQLDELLWRHPPQRFLPHGPWDGPDPERQPVLLALEPDDRNGATILLLTGPRPVVEAARFDMVVDFVTGREDHLVGARSRYRDYRNQGCLMEYWVQSANGRWTRQDKKEG
ncbi:MAG: DNA polymerase III subunit chi [Magnetococcales bacterium]|nr:DNA polymerase III subunit chi [Magnetococcales bacterium]